MFRRKEEAFILANEIYENLFEKQNVTDKMRHLILLRIAKYLAESVLNDNIAIDAVKTTIAVVSRNENGHARVSMIATSAMKGLWSPEEQLAQLVIKHAVNNSAKDRPIDEVAFKSKLTLGINLLFQRQDIDWQKRILDHVEKTIARQD